ncbi:MAG: hypothetical protein DRI90_28145, partial [Deltaproteobacteria bacterium]
MGHLAGQAQWFAHHPAPRRRLLHDRQGAPGRPRRSRSHRHLHLPRRHGLRDDGGGGRHLRARGRRDRRCRGLDGLLCAREPADALPLQARVRPLSHRDLDSATLRLEALQGAARRHPQEGWQEVSAPLPIAVVIPAYRSEEFLGLALDSVLAQTELPSEILVVDDGSPGEATRAICAARSDAVRYLRKDNGGPASARNLGARESSAEWLAFLDADDVWYPEKLERQWAALQNRPEARLVCTQARLLGGSREGELRRAGAAPALDLPSLLSANPIVTSSVLLRRAAFEEAAGFCEDRSLIAVEDYDLWLRVAQQGPLVWIPEPLVGYRIHDASLSGAECFHHGVNLVLDRAIAQLSPEPSYGMPIRRHRATLDRDLAWELL